MIRCRVCGREFDPGRFQVVVPGLGQGFDRVECAEEARTLLGPEAAPPAVAAVVHPFPAAAPAALASATPLAAAATDARRPLLGGANLALLAAGTAATVFLWFRVFGADPAAFELSDPGLAAAPAFERSTIPAQISSGTPSRVRSKPGSEARRAASTPSRASSSVQEAGGTLVAAREPAVPSSPGRAPSGDERAAVGGGSGGGAGGGAGGGSGAGQPKTPAGPTDDDFEDEDEGDHEDEADDDHEDEADDDHEEEADDDDDLSASESAHSSDQGRKAEHDKDHD
jgi:hypothetical protein